MNNLTFKQRLRIIFSLVFTTIVFGVSGLIYDYLQTSEKIIQLELANQLEQSVASLSFHALNYADGERTAIVDINNDISDFDSYFNVLKQGGNITFRNTEAQVEPFSDAKSLDILSQLEAEWIGYKENLLKITNSRPDRIDLNAQKYIVNNVGKVKAIINNLSDHYYQLIQQYDNRHLKYLLTLLVVLLSIFAINLYAIFNFLIQPLHQISSLSQRIAAGELVKYTKKIQNNEIGTVFRGLNEISEGLEKITSFADKVGKSDFNAHLEVRSEKDVLGYALLAMRDNLKKANDEEQKRKWTNEGLAKFVSILRLDNQDLKDLGDKIISNLVKYLNANQGGIFLYNEAKDTLDLLACYAYERKRYIENSVPVGDGLLGQAFLEKDIIYLKEVPDGYVSITSGLGEATPSHLLIIPLKIKDTAYGVIEIASFEDFQDYQKEFLEKTAENIASTIATAKINEKTTRLLRESQEQSEMLRAQEEEMRQNVEELIATQEQMKRKQEEVEFANQKLKTNEAILKKSMEKAKKQGEELQMVNRVLAQRQEEMQQQMKELEKAKAEIEKLKEEEQKRTKLLVEQQKKLMVKFMEDFKNKERNLKEQLAQKEKEIEELKSKN
jgi:predicted RNase H-related nuclease YkuK (DUF458 family)